VSRFAPRHNAANAFAKLLQLETVALSLTHKRTVAFTMWMSNGCAAATMELTISDSFRSLKPIQKIFEDAKNLRHAVAVGSSASQIPIKAMSVISVKIEGH